MEEKPYICIDFLSKNVKKMKKIIMMTLMLVCGMTAVMAQKPAQIKFDKTPLVINQAIASCGCTVPEYTKTPIQPGEKGEIKVTYNGTGKFPGHFKKSITVRTNGAVEMTRLYIEGDMTEAK